MCKYERDIPEVPFDIYDIIELLQKENVNIVDSSYVRYVDSTYASYVDDWNGFSDFWDVTVFYNRYKYGHTRFFDAQTGKIIKEWTEGIWTGRC